MAGAQTPPQALMVLPQSLQNTVDLVTIWPVEPDRNKSLTVKEFMVLPGRYLSAQLEGDPV